MVSNPLHALGFFDTYASSGQSLFFYSKFAKDYLYSDDLAHMKCK